MVEWSGVGCVCTYVLVGREGGRWCIFLLARGRARQGVGVASAAGGWRADGWMGGCRGFGGRIGGDGFGVFHVPSVGR